MSRFVYIYFVLMMLSFQGKYIKAQDLYAIDPVKFNSRDSDFSPVLYKDGIVFCSKRNNKGLKKSTLTDIYYHNENNGKRDAQLFDETFVGDLHDGPVTFSKDFKTMYYSKNLEDVKSNEIKNLVIGIFYSEFIKGQWSKPKPFEYNSPEYSVAHPSLSKDGSMLFFSSNMPGGMGKADIYVCYKTADGWSEPKNLGENVNSSASENFPFHHNSGRLYYSSNRTGSMGGLDIMYTSRINDKWLPARFMSEPINSDKDDFGFTANNVNTMGYFSSNRSGKDDIYEFNYNIPQLESCDTLTFDKHCVTFYENGPGIRDTVDHLKFYWNIEDTTIQAYQAEYCFDEPGEYKVTLDVEDLLTGNYNKAVKTFAYTYGWKDPLFLEVGRTAEGNTALNAHFIGNKEYNTTEFYWELDNGMNFVGEKLSSTDILNNAQYVKLSVVCKNHDESVEIQKCVVRKLKTE